MNLNFIELTELKHLLEKVITEIDLQILEFPISQYDDEFEFLIKKAVSYRETIKKINQELNEL